MTFRLTMYPGKDGDCILLSWGVGAALRHILIDLGRSSTYAVIEDELELIGEVELFVMSHIDADHIAGALPMVRRPTPPFTPKRVWYNGRHQLEAARDRAPIVEPFSARQGEKLSRGIVKFGWPWNAEFASEIVSTDSPEAAEPFELPGELKLWLVSPGDAQLVELLDTWEDDLADANVRPFDPDEDPDPLSPKFEPLGLPNVQKLAVADYKRDKTEANGSSIGFIAEFDDKRVLLAGDAHAEVLHASLAPFAQKEGGKVRLDLMKTSHHGSKANTSTKLLELLDCTRFVFSTNGKTHHHPDPETISRILTSDPDRDKTLYFNYRQPSSEVWDSAMLSSKWKYTSVYGAPVQDDPTNGRLVIDV